VSRAGYGTAAASSSDSSRLRRSSAAATFSSKCLTDEVPGMGSITEVRIRSQASFGDERGAPGALS
jgi:hypothetical protein